MYKLLALYLFNSILITELAANRSQDDKSLMPEPVNSFKVSSKLVIPTIENVKRMAWIAASSVCEDTQLTSLTCKACLHMQTDTPDLKFYKSYINEQSGTKAYVSVSDDNKEVILAYRGGNNFQNALTFLNIFTTPYKPYVDIKGAEVHKGVKEAMENSIEWIITDLKQLFSYKAYKKYKLIVTGHSLGGAMASLATIRLKYELGLDWSRIELYTYGQLRTGNIKFADWFTQQNLVSARGVNYNDQAPHVFYTGIFQTYAHFGNEVWVNNPEKGSYKFCDNTYLEDPGCSNSLPAKNYTIKSHLQFFDTDFSKEQAC